MTNTIETAIYPMLTPASVRVGLVAIDKETCIAQLIDLVAGHEAVQDVEQIRQAVWKREQRMSTGVGEGIALPHAQTSAVNQPVVAFATLSTPIDFDAFDGQPVDLVFLMVTPKNASTQHIKLLSRISRLINQAGFRKQLRRASTPDEIVQLFEQEERMLFGS